MTSSSLPQRPKEPTVSTEDKTPVLDTITAMTAASLERCELPASTLLMVRIAALAAVDARPVSYLAHVGPSLESGVTVEDVQNVLVAVAPVIGTARTMKAAVNISEALGFAIAVLESEVE
jgi:alkylhydroperoxidase/carboxymuconolactone decarboxylase family protein YurZ